MHDVRLEVVSQPTDQFLYFALLVSGLALSHRQCHIT